MASLGKRQTPARRRESAIIESSDLARHIKIDESELQQLAVRHQLPFNFSTLGGLWIRKDSLAAWRAAAADYRRNRERADESAFYP